MVDVEDTCSNGGHQSSDFRPAKILMKLRLFPGPAGIEGGCSAIEFSGNRWDSTNSTTSRKKLDRLDRDLDELDRVLDQLDDLRVKIDSTDSIDSIEISTNSIEFSINSMSREVRVFLKMKFWR